MRTSMMSKSDYFLRIKHKPAQKLLLDKAKSGNLTEEDIEGCGQPLWVRQALLELIENGGVTNSQRATSAANAIADAMQAASKVLPAPKFPVFEWVGPEMLIKPQRGFSYDIQTGDYFLVDIKAHQVKVNYSVLSLSSSQISSMLNVGKFIGDYTDLEYVNILGLHKQRG